jgi:hypothetical protein
MCIFFTISTVNTSVGYAFQILDPDKVIYPITTSHTKAPDGTPAATLPYLAKVSSEFLGERGTLALWFQLLKPLRTEKLAEISLVKSEAIEVRISPRGDSVALVVHFNAEMTGRDLEGNSKQYSFECLLTHLKASKWYHLAVTWDCKDWSKNTLYLDGVAQTHPRPYAYSGQVAPAVKAVSILVGSDGLVVSPVSLYRKPLTDADLRSICKSVGHKGYEDEGLRFSGIKFYPSDVDWSHPVYACSFDDPKSLEDWQLEGGHSVKVENGNLLLDNGSGENSKHLVYWLKREVPADFLLEFTFQPRDRKEGLAIVFFNARGIRGESIFDPSLAPRDANFVQYHSGDINCYHVSFWSGGRGTVNIRKNRGFHLVAVGKDLVADGPSDAFQTIKLYKRGGKIRLMVDDVVAVSYDDDGKTYGPIWTHSGWIGIRQMSHTGWCKYGHIKIYPLMDNNSGLH